MKRFLAIALLLVACSSEKEQPDAPAKAVAGPPPPTAEQARALLDGSAELGEHQFTQAGWTAPVADASMSAPVRDEAKQFAEAGWLDIDSKGDLSLAQKARGDKRFLLRTNGLLDIVPLAKKEMGDVIAVRANADKSVAVDFTWKWLPNEVGSALKIGPVHDRFAAPQQSTATLMWDGTNWMILKIE